MKFGNSFSIYLARTLEAGCIPMLIGNPGIGKSSFVNAYAAGKHTKCFTLACNQLYDKADLTGARTIQVGQDDFVQKFFPHDVVRKAIDYAEANPRENPILFLDELNRTTADVTSALLSVATDRKVGSFKLPKNLQIIVAGNDKGHVTSLDEASISRFVPIHIEPDTSVFLGLDPNLNIYVKNVLSQKPDCIFGRKIEITVASNKNDNDDDEEQFMSNIDSILDEEEGFEQITTPRTIMAVSRWLNATTKKELLALIGESTVDENGDTITTLQECLHGFVGNTLFGTLLYTEIINTINSVSATTASTLSVAKPAVYDEMKTKTDRTALNEYVNAMTDNDRSGCLVYALHENCDNTTYIDVLNAHIQKLEPDDMKTLASLIANDNLDKGNIDYMMSLNSPVATLLSAFIA